MSKSEDINTLFRRFGGNAGTYQEIGASELAGAATTRWPLLGELRPQAHREAPDARKGGALVGDRQVKSFLVPPAGAPAAPNAREMISDALPEPVVARVVEAVPVAVAAVPLPPIEPSSESLETPKVKPKQAARGARSGSREQSRAKSEPTRRGSVDDVPVLAQEQKPPVQTVKKAVVAKGGSKKQQVSDKAAKPPRAPEADRGEEGAELQSLFNRLLPPKVDSPSSSRAAPLKRLVKW